MLRVEFHTHTSFSKDSLVSPRALVEACGRRGIDRVVVTDHNTLDGARAAHDRDPQRVIIGEEIMTTAGELLAAYVSEVVPAGLTPQAAIDRLREQEAFISVSHPFDGLRKGGWSPADLIQVSPLVDALEVFNSRCTLRSANQRAADFARERGLPGTVGSDAHTVWEIGRSILILQPFADAFQLREAVRRGAAYTRLSPPWIHLASRYARLRKWLGVGLDTAERP